MRALRVEFFFIWQIYIFNAYLYNRFVAITTYIISNMKFIRNCILSGVALIVAFSALAQEGQIPIYLNTA